MFRQTLRTLLEALLDRLDDKPVDSPIVPFCRPILPAIAGLGSNDLPIERLLGVLPFPRDRVVHVGLSMGTFNPIHLWHLQVAQCSWVQLGLDFVIFIPNGQPPHKHGVAPKELRYRMVKAGIEGNERFCHSRIELDREGNSYTVDTLRQLRRLFEAAGIKVEFYLIIGMDNVDQLKKWRSAPELLAPGLCNLIIAPRYSRLMSPRAVQRAIPLRKRNVDWFLLQSPDSDLSSTMIRDWIASGGLDGCRNFNCGNMAACADYLVPNKVRLIIQEDLLYRQ